MKVRWRLIDTDHLDRSLRVLPRDTCEALKVDFKRSPKPFWVNVAIGVGGVMLGLLVLALAIVSESGDVISDADLIAGFVVLGVICVPVVFVGLFAYLRYKVVVYQRLMRERGIVPAYCLRCGFDTAFWDGVDCPKCGARLREDECEVGGE